jgi:hypothetical protein
MPKTAVAAALAPLILVGITPTAQAMPMVPHHSVFAGLNADTFKTCNRGVAGATAGDASAAAKAAARSAPGLSSCRRFRTY